MFRVLTGAVERLRSGDSSVSFVFWLDRKQLGEFDALLPDSNDGTLENYLHRVGKAVGGLEFTLLLANPHLYNEAFWRTSRSIARELFEHVGYPCGGIDTCMFLGTYRKTPFGVHRGQMSVVTFPVLGTKQFLLWPRGYGESHDDIRDSLEYDHHLDHAIEAAGSARDMLYWPADYWHIADGTGASTAAWNIGIWWDRPPIVRVLEEVSEILADTVESADSRGVNLRTDFGSNGAAIPTELREALAIIRGAVSGQDLDHRVARQWLKFASADGFRDVPPLLGAPPPSPQARLRLVPNINGLVYRHAAGLASIAANGHVGELVLADDTLDLLDALKSGKALSIEDPQLSPQSREALSFLLNADAVQAVDPDQGT